MLAAGVGTVPHCLGCLRRTSRCSRQGGHDGLPRFNVFPARPAAELGRSALRRTLMAGYSSTPLAKKLGIKPGSSVFVDGAPMAYEQLFAPMPDGVRVQSAVD